jgi:hypothetical protein
MIARHIESSDGWSEYFLLEGRGGEKLTEEGCM